MPSITIIKQIILSLTNTLPKSLSKNKLNWFLTAMAAIKSKQPNISKSRCVNYLFKIATNKTGVNYKAVFDKVENEDFCNNLQQRLGSIFLTMFDYPTL